MSSIAPAGGFFDGTYYDNDNYLSEQDIAFNLEQLERVTTNEEGYLVKTVPQNEESEVEARIETVNHTIQTGESLEEIADLYELKLETITHENNIVNLSDVHVGQVLKIPPVDGLTHTVNQGENVSTIAARYSVGTQEILEINNLDSSYLKVGQKVFVPGGDISSLIAAKVEEPEETNTSVTEATEEDLNSDTSETPTEENTAEEQVESADGNFTPIDQLNSVVAVVEDPDPQPNEPVISEGPVITENPEVEAQVAPVAAGTWGMPTVGQVTQGYHRGHYAIDLADRSKPPIWAAADGVVVTAQGGWNGGYGNYIIIDHGNGYKTLYAHNEEIYVSVGETVTKGQVIAKMGNSGRVYGVTGIHLHYECRLNGQKINPYNCMP